MTDVIILGTGNALVTKCYNTCFALENENGIFMVDAGGGNRILAQMEKAELSWKNVKGLYLTHMHTDHVLGVIWVVRKIATMINGGKYEGDFHIYGLAEGLDFVQYACKTLLTKKMSSVMGNGIYFHPMVDGDSFDAIGIHFTAFDIHSTKMNQMGFKAELPDGKVLSCLGDEPYNELCKDYVVGADWMMSEAFCLYEDRDVYHPYEKCHSTAKDAGVLAEELGCKNVIIYHTEDSDLENRAARYGKECKENFSGNVFVPMDLERISLK